jgi:sulfoxide reductase catalytic subunit YedY
VLIRKSGAIPSSEITPKQTYWRRREFLAAAGSVIGTLDLGGLAGDLQAAATLSIAKKVVTTTDKPTPYEAVTTYNNFYEFGSRKDDPARLAKGFNPKPWSVAVEGACAKPGTYPLEDILKPHPLEERIYRHRCVEGW